MTQESVARPSTKMLRANEELCRQAAGFLFCEPEPVISALEGEPLEVLLGMTRWCLKHEGPGFDPAKVLPTWAEKRGRGRWSDRPTQAARTVWGESPAKLNGCSGCSETRRELHEVREDHESVTFHEGDLICEVCAEGAGVAL